MARSKYLNIPIFVKGYFALPRNLYNSLDFQSLSTSSVKLLIDLCMQFNGSNNGDLSCEWSKMRLFGWKSKQTLYKALKELQDKNLIIIVRQGQAGGKHSQRRFCSLYALTWLPIDNVLNPDKSPKHKYGKTSKPPRLNW